MKAISFDPVSLEIAWSRLVSIADEAAATLVRTAFSTIVRESNDFATVLMDRNGNSMAENTGGIASFSCILPITTKHFLKRFPVDTWRPGDCVVTNDPWLATAHLPDITAVVPIFHRGRLAGFAGSVAHMADIGGSLWSADCREVFEEGVRIPPMHLLRDGWRNEVLLDILMANVRLPEQVMGDIEALLAANQMAIQRSVEFLEDTGLDEFAQLSPAMHDRSDALMRQAIETIPDGVYRSAIDADGYDEDRTHIECTITVQGSDLAIDYAGTSKQIDRGINSPMNYTHAYSLHSIKCALDPLTPRNEGSYRALKVSAPPGCILNPLFPAAVGARNLSGLFVSCAIYQALADAIPDRIIADCGAPTARPVFSGVNRYGQRFSQVFFAQGGMGAAAHRDGLSTTAFPSNAGAGSIEAMEAVSPLLFRRKEYRIDSGGAGRYRGGLGQDCAIENLSGKAVRVSLMAERLLYPACGLRGGGPGGRTEIHTDDGSKPHPKSRHLLAPGGCIEFRFAGGGGFGPPAQRDPEAIRTDVMNGLVSATAAARDYGWEGGR